MGRYLKQNDKDYMKVAMLKQEETFRQQVHELHRLYQVQKLLMNDMKEEVKRQRKSSNARTKRILDLELPAEEYLEKNINEDATKEAEEESELDLTLAIGSNRRRKKDNSSTSNSGASFSWSSIESGGIKLNGNHWGLFQVTDLKDSCRSERKSEFNADGEMSEERVKRHPWLLQCLSLNMT